MKNTQKGFVGIILILILILAIGIGGMYYVTNKKQDVVVDTTQTATVIDTKTSTTVMAASTTSNIDTKTNALTTSISTRAETDMYQNGTYPGFIKSVYEKNDGTVTVDIDIYQTFAGKQAFLELAKSIYYDDPEYPNPDSFKRKYPTYSVLEKSILPMSEEEFDNMLAEWPWTQDGGDNRIEGVNDSTIGGSYYKGTIYRKNKSTKIRTFTLDKNAIIYINRGSGPYLLQDDFVDYFVAESNYLKSKFESDWEFDLKFDFDITIKDGVIMKMNNIFSRQI